MRQAANVVGEVRERDPCVDARQADPANDALAHGLHLMPEAALHTGEDARARTIFLLLELGECLILQGPVVYATREPLAFEQALLVL